MLPNRYISDIKWGDFIQTQPLTFPLIFLSLEGDMNSRVITIHFQNFVFSNPKNCKILGLWYMKRGYYLWFWQDRSGFGAECLGFGVEMELNSRVLGCCCCCCWFTSVAD